MTAPLWQQALDFRRAFAAYANITTCRSVDLCGRRRPLRTTRAGCNDRRPCLVCRVYEKREREAMARLANGQEWRS